MIQSTAANVTVNVMTQGEYNALFARDEGSELEQLFNGGCGAPAGPSAPAWIGALGAALPMLLLVAILGRHAGAGRQN